MNKCLSIFRVRVKWGRGPMESDFLVAATSPIVAKRVANKAATLPTSMHNITCYPISDLKADISIKKPKVIWRL